MGPIRIITDLADCRFGAFLGLSGWLSGPLLGKGRLWITRVLEQAFNRTLVGGSKGSMLPPSLNC